MSRIPPLLLNAFKRGGFPLTESMDGLCVAARAPAVTMISGSIFYSRALISSSSDLYLSRFRSMVSSENLSLQ